jgi:hypothetical protein
MLVIPILLLTVFGLIEMARIFISYATIQHAAQEGARFAVTGKCDDTLISCDSGMDGVLYSIEIHTQDSTTGLIIDEDAVNPGDPGYLDVAVKGTDRSGQFYPEERPGDPGAKTYITVTYSMPVITPFISSIAPAVTLNAEVIVTNETQGGTLSQEGGHRHQRDAGRHVVPGGGAATAAATGRVPGRPSRQPPRRLGI